MATGKQITDRAMAFSSANDPGITAGDPELLIVLNAKLLKLYRRAFSLNPSYFGALLQVSYAAPGWPVPGESMGVYHITNEDGVEVHVVPVSEKDQVALPPRVYRLGAEYRTVGEEDDPEAGEALNMYFGRRPVLLTALGDSLPEEWPVEHEDLLVVEVARHLALKDKNRGDHKELVQLRDDMLTEFDATITTAEPREGRFVDFR